MHPHHAGLLPASSCATLTLWGAAAARWAAHGFDLATLGTLLGGAGTFVFSLVAASREIRNWKDRNKPASPESPQAA
jgi:hypothetical protein